MGYIDSLAILPLLLTLKKHIVFVNSNVEQKGAEVRAASISKDDYRVLMKASTALGSYQFPSFIGNSWSRGMPASFWTYFPSTL